MQGKLFIIICAVALTKGVLSNIDPRFVCSRACHACNCLPTEPTTVCSAQDAEGILLPHENCNQFYICNYGSKVTFDCPDNLHFNPVTEQCDFPLNVVCGDRVIPDKEEENEVSDGSESNDHDNVSVVEEEEHNNSNSDSSDESGNEGNDNNGETNCNCDPAEASLICSAKGSDGTLVAHEICNKYSVCNHGVPTTMSCPEKLLYNPYTERCDWSDNVECGDRIIIAEPEDTNESSANSDDNDNNEESGTCDCNSGEASLICSVQGSDGILVAHEICNKFYVCNHRVPTTVSCPRGLLYNPCIKQCDWPHNVECGNRVIVTEPEHNSESSDNSNEKSNENDNTQGNSTCNCNPGEAPLICAVGGSDGTLVAHEVCNKYYVCNHGVPATMNCPKGLLYNPFVNACDWPHNVECGDRMIVEEVDSNDSSEVESNESSSSENDNAGVCNCDPAEAPSICSNEGSDGTLVAHEICCKYYVCNHGLPLTMSCPLGLLYNPHTKKCDWPHNVECGDREINDNNNSSDSSHSSNESENEKNSNESDDENDSNEIENNKSNETEDDTSGNNNGGNGTCNCNPAEASTICSAENSDSILIAHEVCCWFYKCEHGVPTVQVCPSGLLYNPYIEQCDWPQNVDCGDRVLAEEENKDHSDEESTEEQDIDLFEIAKAKCAESASDGQFAIHENCHQFYVCLKHEPAVLSCPLGLLYNAPSETCEWPQHVQCGKRILIAS